MDYCYVQARIDRSAIEHNCRLLKGLAAGRRFCPAVKADAYGHGIRVVLPVLQKVGADMLAVACIEEAAELYELGWTGPVLVFGSEFSAYNPSLQVSLAEFLVEHKIRITLTRAQDAQVLSRAAERLKKTVPVHLALDTGMCRMGLGADNLWDLIDSIRSLPSIWIEGLYTHFAAADSGDKTFARGQLTDFNRFIQRLKEAGIAVPIVHAANSGATVDLPEAHFDMVRPGISVYGYHASNEMHHRPDLRPALQLVSALTLVKTIPAGSRVGYGGTFATTRKTTVGLVPIGYADGYARELSNRGKMIVRGRAVPVIGRVSMDQTILDLTDLAGPVPEAGDEVIIYDCNLESPNSVENTANLLNTIPYVITTSLGRRVKRVGCK